MVVNETEVMPIFADTDAMQIVYHGTYVTWMELGRTKLMEKPLRAYEKKIGQQIWLPIIALDIRYKTPAKLYEKLVVRTKVKSMKAATIEFEYEIVNKETGEVHVTGTTKHPLTDTDLNPLNIKKHHTELYDTIIKMMK
ncbi:MAG: acyl-CoA thioesterase [Eubacteriaceae bacterium]|jgi:acyl-CoA thioester hydrolase|nr:acyl-CoA thioesterase [Eubacteriaceae bacterium]